LNLSRNPLFYYIKGIKKLQLSKSAISKPIFAIKLKCQALEIYEIE